MREPLSHQELQPLALEELEACDSEPLRVLVVRLSAMGDVIHGLPAIAALRRAKPNLQIGWLVERRWMELLCAHSPDRLQPRSELKPLIDWVHVSDFKEWRKGLSSSTTWRDMRSCMREVRAMKYQVTLDLQGAIRSAMAARLSGAKTRIGSSAPREAPARQFYTMLVPVQGSHVVEHALSLTSAIASATLAYESPVFPQDPATEAWADRFCSAIGFMPLAIVNPGAGWGAKCWPAESYGTVAGALAKRGVAVAINHGPGEEGLANSVKQASGSMAHAVGCSISQLIALMRRASLFVGGDTGPMHLAAALGVPVVALFGPTRPDRNGPFATPATVLRNPISIDNSSHIEDPDAGLNAICPEQVIIAADVLLKEQNG